MRNGHARCIASIISDSPLLHLLQSMAVRDENSIALRAFLPSGYRSPAHGMSIKLALA